MGSYFVEKYDTTNKDYEYLTLVNSQHQMSSPLMVNQMNQALIRKITSNDQVEINVINRPLKFSTKTKSIEGAIDAIIGGFIFSIALSFIPASIITFSVKEREDQVKHQ